MGKASENIFPKVRMSTTVSSAAPSGGEWRLESRANGIYAVSSNTGAAGTGPFTSASGSITTSDVALSGSNVSVTSGADATIVSLSLAAGTWLLFGSVLIEASGAGADYYFWIDDATTVYGSGQTTITSNLWVDQVPVQTGAVVLGSTTTMYLKGRSSGNTGSAKIVTTAGSKGRASSLVAIKVA